MTYKQNIIMVFAIHEIECLSYHLLRFVVLYWFLFLFSLLNDIGEDLESSHEELKIRLVYLS